jgi:hypothetical protein
MYSLPSTPNGFNTNIIELCYSDSLHLGIIKYFSGAINRKRSAKLLFLFALHLVYFQQLTYKI